MRKTLVHPVNVTCLVHTKDRNIIDRLFPEKGKEIFASKKGEYTPEAWIKVSVDVFGGTIDIDRVDVFFNDRVYDVPVVKLYGSDYPEMRENALGMKDTFRKMVKKVLTSKVPVS